jgi:YbbR domain-containing protein
VEVVQVTPPTVAVVFEPTASRMVPIKPATEGQPAAGYIVRRTTVDPPSVEVVGPESAVSRVTEALTEPVNVAAAQRSVQETVNVGTLDPSLRVKAPRTATVTVDIVPAPLGQTVRDRPVHLRNLAPALTATAIPATVDVAVRGSREALQRIRPDDVMAFVDLVNLGAGDYTLAVGAEISRDAGVARIEPATIQVRISIAEN